ncbi:MAG: hypothetical protein U0271_02615 [Polyangiaceae bacterium]
MIYAARIVVESSRIARRHVAVGFAGLALFVLVGLGLEAAHALKAPGYLDADHTTRRLLLRLGHAHGGLVSMVHILYGLAAHRWPAIATPLTSLCYWIALLLVPGGFLLGAIGATASDPGIFVLLVPPGAFAFMFGLGLTAKRLWADLPDEDS